jgi:hypothetical protein
MAGLRCHMTEPPPWFLANDRVLTNHARDAGLGVLQSVDVSAGINPEDIISVF